MPEMRKYWLIGSKLHTHSHSLPNRASQFPVRERGFLSTHWHQLRRKQALSASPHSHALSTAVKLFFFFLSQGSHAAQAGLTLTAAEAVLSLPPDSWVTPAHGSTASRSACLPLPCVHFNHWFLKHYLCMHGYVLVCFFLLLLLFWW